MYRYSVNWKSFSVSLPCVDNWCKTNFGTNYVGNSADYDLTLWFTDEPNDIIKLEMQAYWDSIDESSEEAINYVSDASVTSAIADLKTGLLTKTWDEMSIVERKLVTNQAITLEDLGYAITYHAIPDGYEGYGA